MMSICFDLMLSSIKTYYFVFELIYYSSLKCDSVGHVNISRTKIELVNSDSQVFDLGEISKAAFFKKEQSGRSIPLIKEFHRK